MEFLNGVWILANSATIMYETWYSSSEIYEVWSIAYILFKKWTSLTYPIKRALLHHIFFRKWLTFTDETNRWTLGSHNVCWNQSLDHGVPQCVLKHAPSLSQDWQLGSWAWPITIHKTQPPEMIISGLNKYPLMLHLFTPDSLLYGMATCQSQVQFTSLMSKRHKSYCHQSLISKKLMQDNPINDIDQNQFQERKCSSSSRRSLADELMSNSLTTTCDFYSCWNSINSELTSVSCELTKEQHGHLSLSSTMGFIPVI